MRKFRMSKYIYSNFYSTLTKLLVGFYWLQKNRSVVRNKEIMMIAFRYLMAMSIGVTIALGNAMEKPVQASPSKANQNAKSSTTTNASSNVRSIRSQHLTLKKNKYKPKTSNSIRDRVSQLPGQDTNRPATSKPESLEPNANPLNFPTVPGEVKTENEQAITLKQAIELALRNNKQLQQARLTLESSRKALESVTATQYPTLDLQLGLQNSDSAQSSAAASAQRKSIDRQAEQARRNSLAQGDSPEEANQAAERVRQQLSQNINNDNNTSGFQGALQLNYDVYTGGEKSARIARAERTARRDELELERLTEDTRSEAARRYYELQNADSQVDIDLGAVKDASQTLKDAQLLEQAGLGTRFDVLRAEVELAQAQQTLSQSQATQRNARRQLVTTLSLGEKVNLTTADEVEEAGAWKLPLEDSIVLAYKNRAELERFLVEREIADEDREIQLSQVRPKVNLRASYDVFDELDNSDSDFSDGYSLQAQMNWRLFDWGSARAAGEQADVQKQIAETQFAGQRNQIRFEVEQAFNNQISNKENIGTSRKALELAQESLRLARLRFQAGVGTQTDVIDAQRQLTDARGNYLQAIINYNQSLNQLQRAVSNFPEDKLFDIVP
jgi:OMF family outer membrane factor